MALALAGCLALAGLALAAGSGKLDFLGSKVEGEGPVTGVNEPDDVAVSGDGKNVYLTALSGTGDVAVFKRYKRSGKLTFVQAKQDAGNTHVTGPENLVVSPDGKFVYVAAYEDNAISIFKRSRRTGKLSYVGQKANGGDLSALIGPYDVVISHDGKTLYASTTASIDPDAIVVFDRNSRTGKLRFVQQKVNGVGDTTGIDDPNGIVLSRDGKNLYVVGEDAGDVVTFNRNPSTGRLSFPRHLSQALTKPFQPAVSRDGKNVYVTLDGGDPHDSGIAIFSRKANGKITLKQVKRADQTGLSHLLNSYDVAVARNGKHVYVAAYNGSSESSLVAFRRNTSSGKLSHLQTVSDGLGGVDAKGLWRVDLSPDGRNAYTANYDGNGVGAFKIRK